MLLVAFDPGETVGYAKLDAGKPYELGQFHWQDWLAYTPCLTLADQIVVERFALYAHAAQTQINNEFPTCQAIGVIRYLAAHHAIPIAFQPAALIHHKGKINPTLSRKIEPWAHHPHAQRHALDALAHGFAYLLRHDHDHDHDAPAP